MDHPTNEERRSTAADVGDDGSDGLDSDGEALEPIETADGTVYVDRMAAERGSLARFYVVYAGADRGERWGYYCDACGSVDNAVDTMGRIVCNRCENMRKAEEWDAAHE